ncbi:LiaF domain-containing protein [Nonomuraea antimicrobica]
MSASGVPAAVERQVIHSKFSKMVRKGRWVASRNIALSAHFGALIIDLSDAVLPGREITIRTHARFSKMIIRVPENAHVIDEGSSAFGKRNVTGGGPGTDGPLIRLTGSSAFSKVIVTRGKDDWNLH